MRSPKPQIAHFTSPLYLDSGRILEPFELAYETYGTLNADKSNAILVAHAFSGSHHAAGVYEGDNKVGWWNDLIGSGKGIDTDSFFVICINALGSCYGSTCALSPQNQGAIPYRLKFPVITIPDIVRSQKVLLASLGIDKLKAVVGGSMGGMVALSFAKLYPKFAEHIIALATTHATSDYVIAAHKVMCDAIMKDPRFKAGNYLKSELAESPLAGLALARMIGYLQYLSPRAMQRKFNHRYVDSDGLYELFGRFEVSRYLDYNAQSFCRYFDPLCYLYLAKALCIYDLSLGHESLEDATKDFRSCVHLIAFSDDTMFPPHEMWRIKQALQSNNKPHTFHEVQSQSGHDSFLVEVPLFEHYIKHILAA